MVRCTKCGIDNVEGAKYCIQCGVSLYSSRARSEKYEKTEAREVCLVPPPSLKYFWLFVGLVIIFWGVAELVGIYFDITVQIWPFILIAIGIYVIYQVLSRSQRK